ncbi:hypothetical protein COCSADRAFT_79116, partial [Bipolaris sorokiniana ND90Pr]
QDIQPNLIRPLVTEEVMLCDHILDLDWRGFPVRLSTVKGLANSLPATRNYKPVSQN